MEPRWAQTDRDGPDDDERGQQRPPSSLFLQLPSNATLRFRGSVAKAWGAAVEEGAPQERDGEEAGEQDSVPLKQLPLCMADKRRLRLQEQQAAWKRSRWEQWQVGTRRLWGQVRDALLDAQVWRGSLHHIEGHFGTGIQSYFNFLRFLVLLNLGGGLLMMGFVVAPNAAFEGLQLNQTQKGPNSTVISSCLQYDPTKRGLVSYFTYLMDLLSGTGFMELTHLFYGYYQNSAVHFVGFSYNIPLAYLLSVLGYFSVCLLWIVRRAVHLLKRSLVSENGALNTYSNKVFAGWDFCLGPGTTVHMKHNSLRYELRVRLLVTHGPAPLARLWGEQEFLVPPNVLDLVYGQTVCWVGAAFSPLLPLLNTTKFVLLFYLKKLTLFSNCRPADRTFRASSSSFFFLLVLLLGLAIAWVPLLYSVFVLQPSQACGPFRGEPTMWSTLWAAIDTLPHVAREFLQFVGSLAFAVPLFLLLCILMFYLMALAHSYSRLVKELKGQLQLEGRDKVFLVTQITELS
nr:transmembrane channel-like protein 4 [Chelonoidis abingdonii]